MFTFDITARQKNMHARTGIFYTPHHKLLTPELAIVATEGEIRSVPRELWQGLPNQYLIVNTYHTFTKKADSKPSSQNLVETIRKSGGVHTYMGLQDKTFATDSGGFQVFSLGFGKKHHIGKLGRLFPGENTYSDDTNNPNTISEKGVSFVYDGEDINLSPEK